MKRGLLILAAAMPLAIGCGVAKDKHARTLQSLKKCRVKLKQSRMALKGVKGDLSKTSADRDRVKGALTSMGDEKQQLAMRLGATKKELAQLRKQRELADARARTFRQLVERLRSMIDSGKLKVQIRKGRMIVQLSDNVLFPTGKARLKDAGRKPLAELAKVLKEIKERDFLVAGHTDNVPIRRRRFRSNWELSTARAVQVVRFLRRKGVDPKRLAAAGFSQFDPLQTNRTKEGRQANRRIEIILMPKISELPTMDSSS